MSKLIRRLILIFSFLAFSVIIPAGCGKTDEPVSLAFHVWPGYELTKMAFSMGEIAPDDLQIVSSQSATDSMLKLKNGLVDGAGLTIDEAITLDQSGTNLKVIAILNISVGADVVIARQGLNKPEDLIGKKLGYEPGSVAELVMYKFLEISGLKEDQLDLLPLSHTDKFTALTEGMVDAVVTYPPTSRRLISAGGVSLFDSSALPNLIYDVLVIREDKLDRINPAKIERILNGHFFGKHHLTVNPDDASYRLSESLGLTPKDALNSFRGLVIPSLNENHRLLAHQGQIISQVAEEINTILLQRGYLSHSADTSELFTDEFLPRELKSSW